MKESHVTTFMDRVRRAIRAFKGKPLGSLTFGIDIKQCKDCGWIKEAEQVPVFMAEIEDLKRTLESERAACAKCEYDNEFNKRTLYRCDGKACGPECPIVNCDLTYDVNHARNINEPNMRFAYDNRLEMLIEKPDDETLDKEDED